MSVYINEVEIQTDRYPTTQCYPFNIPTLQHTARLVFKKPVVFS